MKEPERRRDAGTIHQVSEMLGSLTARVEMYGEKIGIICEKLDHLKEERSKFVDEFRQHVSREEAFIVKAVEANEKADKALLLATDLDETRKRIKYGVIGAASIGAVGGTGISGIIAWLKGWF